MSKLNLKKIQEIVSKKSTITETYEDLTKTRFDISFNLIEDIVGMLEDSYESHKYHEELRKSNFNNEPVMDVPYTNLKPVIELLMNAKDTLVEQLPQTDKTVFESTNKGNYKAGKIKLDDGKTMTLSKLDADYLNAFAGTDLKWYRLLTKSEKDFKEIVALSKS